MYEAVITKMMTMANNPSSMNSIVPRFIIQIAKGHDYCDCYNRSDDDSCYFFHIFYLILTGRLLEISKFC